ncbi:unnamed protein product [Sphagnum compactum]
MPVKCIPFHWFCMLSLWAAKRNCIFRVPESVAVQSQAPEIGGVGDGGVGVRGVYGQTGLPGTWEILLQNAGIASMHSAVTRFNTVVLLDRTDIGASQIPLANGACRNDPNDLTLQHDCTAHSVLFDPATNTVRPLTILTDTWCSSGQFSPDGTLIQTGGDFDGFKVVREFSPCPANGTCDWVELTTPVLEAGRWYATNQLLPDGTQIIIGGRSVFTFEYIPPNGQGQISLPLLTATNDPEEDNLYPFVFLLPDGNLFIFANTNSIIYSYLTDTVVSTFPPLPGNPRNYPSAGSAVMLPLLASNQFAVVEVLVCGGAQYGAFLSENTTAPCSTSCGRITVTDPAPAWAMETMPIPRCMGDMILLPSQDILIINGAQAGSQGWGYATDAALYPILYSSNAAVGMRFATLAPSTIARMYHSTANLLPDGRILCAGSNPHQFYTFSGPFPTELRLDAFSPPYLAPAQNPLRCTITAAPAAIFYNTNFTITFTVPLAPVAQIELNLLSAPFVTHSFAQGQRLLSLATTAYVPTSSNEYAISGTAPPSPQLAPPSYYMLYAVNQAIPGTAVWVQVAAPQ